MLASESQNLLPAPEMAGLAYRWSAAHLPALDRTKAARRAEHLASVVRFGLNEPEAMRRLHGVTEVLHDASQLESLLPKVLDGALSLMGADLGNIQLRDPVTGSLWLVTQSGFGSEFLDYFAVVDDGHSACGRAAQAGAQAVIPDVDTDEGFAPHRDIAAASGFRAVQSTPLVDYAGRLVGMVSTHYRRPYRPSARDLQIMALYGDIAGEAVARRLGLSPSGDGQGDPIGQAVISALLDPGHAVHRPASHDESMSQFAGEIVNRLFAVGLSLERARGAAGDGPAGEPIAAAAGELDQMIREIREMMFRSAADRARRVPAPVADGQALLRGGYDGLRPFRS